MVARVHIAWPDCPRRSRRPQVSGSDKGADARLLDTEGQFGIVKLASGAIKAVDYDALVKGVK